MFEQRQGETLYGAWIRFKDLLRRVPHHGDDHVDYHAKRAIDRAAGGRLQDRSAEESWEIINELASDDNEVWQISHNVRAVVKTYSSSDKANQITKKSVSELERRVACIIEKQKRSSSPQRATVNSVSSIRAMTISEPPRREDARTLHAPTSPPQQLSPTFESQMRELITSN